MSQRELSRGRSPSPGRGACPARCEAECLSLGRAGPRLWSPCSPPGGRVGEGTIDWRSLRGGCALVAGGGDLGLLRRICVRWLAVVASLVRGSATGLQQAGATVGRWRARPEIGRRVEGAGVGCWRWSRAAPSGAPVETWTVLFTDQVGSTAMRVRVGEEAFDGIRADLDARVAAALTAHGVVVTKSTGDGVMGGFTSTAAALRCAVAIQQAVAERNRTASEGVAAAEVLALRVGISVGDAVVENGDLQGTAVVEAARLCAAASGGTILCSEAVRVVSANRSGCTFGPASPVELKGLPGPVLAQEVAWEPLALRTGRAPVGVPGSGSAGGPRRRPARRCGGSQGTPRPRPAVGSGELAGFGRRARRRGVGRPPTTHGGADGARLCGAAAPNPRAASSSWRAEHDARHGWPWLRAAARCRATRLHPVRGAGQAGI